MPVWNKKHIDKQVIKRLYTDQRLSISKIAKIYGLSKTPIHRMLHEYKVPIRSNSEAKTLIRISKKKLRSLYFNEKLSMFQIAERLGCTHSAIVYKFKKLGLKSRGHLGLTKPIKITRDGFEYLYYKRGLSLKKISNMTHCSESGLERRFKVYNLKSRTTKNRTCRIKKFNFSGNLIEKAYLIGFRLGDLNIMKRVSVIQVRCSTTHIAQVKLIKGLFLPYTTPTISKAKRGTTEIVCLVNNSFNFLLPKHQNIPQWILNNKQRYWAFFAGYIDAEGCFFLRKPHKRGGTWSSGFEIQTQQEKIIKTLWENMPQTEIVSSFPKISRKAGYVDNRGIVNNENMWRINISRKESLRNFINYVEPYLKHKEKINKIIKIKGNLKSRGV